MNTPLDFIQHGSVSDNTNLYGNQFDFSQTGALWDPVNTSLSGYSLKNDMITSAYFNADVGNFRQLIAAYQIKVDINNKQHRGIFLGGTNYRDGNSQLGVDVNIGNYPLDIDENDTNTGFSWKNYEGIPNIKLKGNSFATNMPIYPLTNQNEPIQLANLPNELLENFSKVSSLMDGVEILRNIFGLSTITMNLKNTKNDTNLQYDTTTGIGNMINVETITSDITCKFTKLNDIYISFTSAVTQWIKLDKMEFTIGSIENESYNGLDGNMGPIQIPIAKNIVIKLYVDGLYCPRQIIGNGMSHQQLFFWNCNKMGHLPDRIKSILQFSFSNYLVYPTNVNGGVKLTVTENFNNEFQITIVFGSTPKPVVDDYIYMKSAAPQNKESIYRVLSISTTGSVSTIILDNIFTNTGTYTIKILKSNDFAIYNGARFNIDEIRDRYCILQLLSRVSKIYRSSSGLSLPLKLVEYMAQIRTTNNLNNLLQYIYLCELYGYNGNSVDSGNKLHQMFHFLQNDLNFYNFSEGGNYGRALRYWDDAADSVVTNDSGRFVCLNTNETIITPSDWNTNMMPIGSISGKTKSIKTNKINKIKHIVITNLPGFNNGTYGTSMSSSNQINGFFGSLSIDVSYSDTHTPVDINGMTIHQWNMNTNKNIYSSADPAKWNMNGDENYYTLTQLASANP